MTSFVKIEDQLIFRHARDSGVTTAGTDRRALISKASRQFWNRQARANFFNRSIFSEAAWDILLALYITEASGRRQTVRKLADWVGFPLTTALRWLDYLEKKEKLIRREPHPDDRRSIFVLLNDSGRELLDAYFASLTE